MMTTCSLTFPPQISLAQLPTPVQPLRRLSEKYGVELYVKRDDLTGIALSGNKIRKLEFVLADALAQKAIRSSPAAAPNPTTAGPRRQRRPCWALNAGCCCARRTPQTRRRRKATFCWIAWPEPRSSGLHRKTTKSATR